MNLQGNFVINFFTIWSMMKVYIIYCILTQTPCLGKVWFLRDMDQNALGQSDCRIFKSTISLEQNNQKAWFLACWYKFMEIKIWLKIIGGGHGQKWVWPVGSQDSKIGCNSRGKQWNKLISDVFIQIQES